MKKTDMLRAFALLDKKLKKPVTLLVGGGAAMLLGYDIPLSTNDVDGLPLDSQMTSAELDPLIKEVARELSISPHWYNDYFNTFTYALPKDFRKRLKEVYHGKKLSVKSLGKEELLIMKCFAGRDKDIGHARALLKRGVNKKLVEEQIESLIARNLPGASKAMQFLDDLLVEE